MFFCSLSDSLDLTLTNQQFVNCAYLEILSRCLVPCSVCLPVDKPSPLACFLHTQSLARPSFWSTGNRWVLQGSSTLVFS